MLSEKMYVRCPADQESVTDPRIFVCGQITKINHFKKTVTVIIHDPFKYLLFFENMPKGLIEVPISVADHCSLFRGSEVVVNGEVCSILSGQNSKKDEFYYYYVQTLKDKRVFRVSEKDIVASFTNGKIDPALQLVRYEFQNPCWYMGHAIVSKNVNVLENSMFGFKELAGAKIYLLPHQVNTIMRCLQENTCRYMLADEVGMGKTIEAISVLKIFMRTHAQNRVLIIIPDTLKEQWKTELLLKFNISVGLDSNNNYVSIKTIDEIQSTDIQQHWDFVIVDEVHRYLSSKRQYNSLHSLSLNAKNILLLSATPVQQRKEEYLDLLRLLQPQKYDLYSIEQFSELLCKQSKIIQKTALILDDLEDLEEEIANAHKEAIDPHESEECEELYEEIYDDLESICKELNDQKLTAVLNKIDFDAEDLGVYQMKVIISYICSNYQVESNIIRNRRKMLETDNEGMRLLPIRMIKSFSYMLDQDKNTHEAVCYQLISDWFSNESLDIETVVKPLLGTFFSSPWAFWAQLGKLKKQGIPIIEEIISEAEKWVLTENHILKKISDIMDDPDAYSDECCTRIVNVLNLLFDEYYDKKIILFTNYEESFHAYKRALETVFPAEEISFFGVGLNPEEIELNAYRFQNESTCRIMLCDYSGGEGRNFQCADYVFHIDLPWDANMIEQRIGRLDRLERDLSRPVVTSIVIYTEETFEEALFDFWNKGLKIFTQSLSGMEIIMKDVNAEIIASVKQDFKYGLFDRIPKIIELANTMREAVRKEQNYDAAGFIYRPMFTELRRLIDYYAQNENILFADAMTNWAKLAGFRGFEDQPGVVTYTSASFSPKSAINSQLIPPHWNEYLSSDQNIFVNKVQEAYNRSKSVKNQERSIRGTFIRKQAIENDYLHFFAPGDDIFECIVNNAMRSCKGTASAFAVPSEIEWKGLIFTWSLSPNEDYLLDHNISAYALGPYRGYLMSEQVVVAISIENPESISDDIVIREFNRMIHTGFYKENTIHLGKRSYFPRYLKGEIVGSSNILWFKTEYPEEKWAEIIVSARKTAYAKALEQFKHRSNIRGAKEEMERILSAKVANSVLYDVDDEKIDDLEKEQSILLEAMRRPKISLDSAAFIWMVKKAYG